MNRPWWEVKGSTFHSDPDHGRWMVVWTRVMLFSLLGFADIASPGAALGLRCFTHQRLLQRPASASGAALWATGAIR